MSRALSTGQATAGALVIAIVLAALHVAAPRIRRLPFVPERATASFAGGLAVAYVFLHLLPEIAEGNESIGEALSRVVDPTPLLDLGIFIVALAGFAAFYGLERLADRQQESADRPRVPGGVYRLHLGSFVIYNALITYTMALRLRTGIAFAVLFTVAMGLHFVLTDRSLGGALPEAVRPNGTADPGRRAHRRLGAGSGVRAHQPCPGGRADRPAGWVDPAQRLQTGTALHRPVLLRLVHGRTGPLCRVAHADHRRQRVARAERGTECQGWPWSWQGRC